MRLYDADFYRWSQETAEALRKGEFNSLDVSALAEEVEDLGKRERAALESRLAVLIGHLLKWEFQPSKRSKSWEATIEIQRTRIARLLRQNPSLKAYLPECLQDAYPEGVLLAIKQTGLDRKTFPEKCPYPIDTLLTSKT